MAGSLQANPWSLLMSTALVLVAVGISFKESLSLEKDLAVGAFRTFVQLYLVGFVLTYVFQIDHPLVTLAFMVVVIFNASHHAAKRGQAIQHAYRISLVTIATTVFLTIGFLVAVRAIYFRPSQVIALSGTVSAASMTALGLVFTHMTQSFHQDRQQILERLALGASPKQASEEIIRASMQKALRPTLDKARAVGLVTFPGTMNGLLLSGVAPLTAVMYQSVIMFTQISTATLAGFLGTYWAYQSFFTDGQLLKDPQAQEKGE
ncbi:ABC transporter permease [Hutsoniella sourekii]